MASLAWDSHYSQSDTNRWVREQSVSGEPGLMGRPQQQLQSGWWREFSLLCWVVRVCACVCGPLWQLWMSFCEQTKRGHLALSQNAFQYITSPLSPPFIIRDGSTVRAHREPYNGHWYSHLNMNDAHQDADSFNQSSPEYLRTTAAWSQQQSFTNIPHSYTPSNVPEESFYIIFYAIGLLYYPECHIF